MGTQIIPGLLDRVAAICGAEFVLAQGTELEAFPADAQQIAQVLRICDAERIPVSIQGSGSKQEWLSDGAPGLRLCTTRMSRVLEHTWQDMTCTVQAGCTWQAMQDALAQHGQMVALDALWPARATVGGVVAANDSGALRFRYGGLRDLVIGITVVLADGTMARSGGKVVKNVAGYDLPKLLCGSFGTLACIAEVTFRLHSIARHSASMTAQGADAEVLGKLLLRLLEGQFSIQAMQMRSTDRGSALDVKLAVLPDVLASQTDAITAAASGLGLEAGQAAEDVWQERAALFDAQGETLVFKATMLPTEIPAAVESVARAGGSAVAQAHGIMTASLPAAALDVVAELRAWLESAGGSLVLLRLPAGVSLDRWGRLPGSMPLMRALKQQFDPHAILNAHRFLGDL